MFSFLIVPLLHAQEDGEPTATEDVVVDANADTDKDGMPDAWEKKMGLNFRNRFDANLDLDGDKVKNIDEYKIGTHPKDKDKDKNNDGVADDWMKYMGFSDASADADGDGVSNKDEFVAGTDPKDPKSSPKAAETVSQKHPEPSMKGVTENVDKSIPDNHQVKPNVFKYNDPVGDDKGPGYYTYPTNPVYASGAFDIVSFVVDASGKDNVIFKITVNADLKQDWGMAADFDVQHFQIYVDMDGVPGSGNVKSIPGLNVFFDPANAWDRVVLITPQPNSRVQIEVDVKAEDLAEYAIVPTKISGQGRTITVVVTKKSLGMASDADVSKWAWQLVAQSNEGFPDAEDMLTRNVNEYRGLHRFGSGSDYWGDPEVLDILVWPAKGTKQEAEDQFKILNVWESYPDPKLDIKAVLPLLKNDQAEQWEPKGGYKGNAKELASKIKPPPQKDKYVSDNFTFAGSVNAQWFYNLDNTTITPTHPEVFGAGGLNATFKPESYYDNHIYSRFTLEFYGKTFTDLLNFYARISTWWGPDAQWDYWMGNYYRDSHGPQYVPLNFEAFRFQLVKPLPTVDYISIGNYEYGISAWTVGASSYPDRDKYKGIFLDGSTESLGIQYNLALFYPFPWLGRNWNLGDYTARDNVVSAMFKIQPIKAIQLKATAFLYSDWEMGVTDTTNNLTGMESRLQNGAVDVDLQIGLKLGAARLSVDAHGGYSTVIGRTNLTEGGILNGIEENPTNNVLNGIFGVATLKLNNIANAGLNIGVQGFYIKDYYSIMAARGDYANAAQQDVLLMYGNQSAHPYPQDAAGFQKYENVMWEGIAAGQWKGLTGIIDWSAGMFKFHTDFSYWGFNNKSWNTLPDGTTNNSIVNHPTNGIDITNFNTLPIGMRGYARIDYKLPVGKGIDVRFDYLFNHTKNWWPMSATSHQRDAMDGAFHFTYGFLYYSHAPKISAYYQFTKLFRIGLGFEYKQDLIYDLYPDTKYPDFPVKTYTLILDFQISTPLGTIRSYVQGYIADNPRELEWGEHSSDFRIPYAYYGNRYNVLALTELDIHF
jgi:hypothetical protein